MSNVFLHILCPYVTLISGGLFRKKGTDTVREMHNFQSDFVLLQIFKQAKNSPRGFETMITIKTDQAETKAR
jgi:hypothetical protein